MRNNTVNAHRPGYCDEGSQRGALIAGKEPAHIAALHSQLISNSLMSEAFFCRYLRQMQHQLPPALLVFFICFHCFEFLKIVGESAPARYRTNLLSMFCCCRQLICPNKSTFYTLSVIVFIGFKYIS